MRAGARYECREKRAGSHDLLSEEARLLRSVVAKLIENVREPRFAFSIRSLVHLPRQHPIALRHQHTGVVPMRMKGFLGSR